MTLQGLRHFRQEIKSIRTVGELLEWLTMKRLERFAFIFILILVLSPLYAMGWSLLFARHTDGAYIANLLGLGNAWHTLILQIGYVGFVVAVILFSKSVHQAKKKGVRPLAYLRTHAIEVFLALFIVWTALATYFSINPALSLKGDFYRREGLWTFGAYLGLFALAKSQTRLNIIRLASVFVGVSVLTGVLDLIDADAINRVLTLKKKTSIFHNANHYGYYLVMALLANAALTLNLRTLRTPLTLPLLVFHAVLTIVVIDNHSFGSFLALSSAFTLSIVLIAWLKRALLFRAVILTALFFGLSWAQSLVDDYLTSEFSGTREDVANIVEGNEEASSAGSGRWSLWTHAAGFALERPLLGYGPDALGTPYEEAGESTDRPHNELLQFAASQGFIAMFLYLGALITLAARAFNKRHALSTLTLTLGFVVIGYLASSMFGNTMYYTTPFYVMFLSFTVSGVKSARGTVIRDHAI